MGTVKKRAAAPRYEETFKIGAIKLITENDRSPREVADELGVHIDTIKNWLKSSGYSTKIHKEKAENKKLRELEIENRSLKKQLEKKTRGYRNSKKVDRHNFRHIKEIYEYIKAHMNACPVVKLCETLKVYRSGFYDWLKRKPSKRDIKNQVLARKLIELHEMYPVYGLDSLYHIIKSKIPCSRARLHRLMKKYNIHSIRYKSNSKHKYLKHNLPVKDNLLQQNFNVSVPNSVWVGDITYIKTYQGWLYLAIVKDLCSKQIVGYATSDKIDTNLTIQALDKAIDRQKPKGNLTFHSDRGSQYASLSYQQRLKHHSIKGSMSRSGNPYDNAVAENFFSCLKCELVHLTTFYTKEQAELELFHYIEKYNNIRPHSAIGWISPNQFARNYNSFSA